jgi:hypothetical protein
LPIISNVYNGKKLDNSILFGALDIINAFQNNSTLNAIISEINYINQTKSYELFLTESNMKILFGKTDNLTEKLNKIYEFWKKSAFWNAAKDNNKLIDVRWKNTIIVTK